ncbi:MAG: hypothetical protein LUH58_03745, partial [Lachnospiraceae bacterium]|nr:hypothetical protein [Lachnospiraceae bacterium]
MDKMRIVHGYSLPIPDYEPVRRFTPQEMVDQDMPGMGSGSKFDDAPGSPAILVEKDGVKKDAVKSGCIYGGTISDQGVSDLKFVTYDGNLGGVMVIGPQKYTIDRATMSLSGKCLGLGLE